MTHFLKEFAVASFLISLTGAVAFAADSSDQPYILVTGQGDVRLKPDRVNLSFGIETNSKDIKQAQAENARRTETLLSALKKTGVLEKNIKTTFVQTGPRYDYSNGKQVFSEYVASKHFSIQMDDIENYGRVLQAALEAGITQMGDVGFDSSHRKEMELEALKLAVQDAAKKGDALAAAAGRKRGEPLFMEAATSDGPRPIVRATAMSLKAGPEDQVAPGEITIRQTVNVKYKLQ